MLRTFDEVLSSKVDKMALARTTKDFESEYVFKKEFQWVTDEMIALKKEQTEKVKEMM